jgi:hypothetical protein
MDRFLKTAELKDLEKKVTKGEISYSKMVEEINLKAYVYYNSVKSNKTNCEHDWYSLNQMYVKCRKCGEITE